jgi:predicted aldo/keto reductase-like oxidoreductase
MEHKLKESNNMVSFLETSVRLLKQIDIRIKRYCVDYSKEINCLKCFTSSNHLNDIMKFDKVKSYIAANDFR